MKRSVFLLCTTLLIMVLLFTNTGAVSASSSLLIVKASRTPGVIYSDSNISVQLYSYPGATIVYTTNGRTPRANIDFWGRLVIQEGIQYTSTITLSKSTTIRAIAVKRYYSPGPVAVFNYELYRPTQLALSVKTKLNGFYYNDTKLYPNNVYYTANDGRSGYFSKTYPGITPGTVNCTWYTFTRIRYNINRNILFSTAGGLDGKFWFSKTVSNGNQIKYSGNNGLEVVVKTNSNRPVYNIVVTFERNGSKTNGHVMLIDAIINGKVFYSENSKPGQLITSNSIIDFKSKYANYNGQIIGVVHLK